MTRTLTCNISFKPTDPCTRHGPATQDTTTNTPALRTTSACRSTTRGTLEAMTICSPPRTPLSPPLTPLSLPQYYTGNVTSNGTIVEPIDFVSGVDDEVKGW